MLAALILLLTPVGRARSSTSRSAPRCSAGLLYGYAGRGGVLAAARRRVPLVARRARGRRRRSPTRSRPTSACRRSTRSSPPRARRRGGCSTARPRPRPELAEEQGRAAAEAERARLARDMHDSLAKTVSGIGFAALALSRRIERDPEGAAEEARRLAEDARQATRQAREIIVGLRADAGESLPLTSALAMRAQRWARGGRARARPRDRGGRRPAPADGARAGVDPRRGAGQRASATRGRRGSACGCAGSARAPC